MNKNSSPIGIFDSGLGGLTVVKQIKKVLPYESIVYLGDTARIPYGTRSKKVIEKFALEDLAFLIGKRVKCVVIACNTVSSLSFQSVKEKSNVEVFGMVGPANKKALSVTKDGRIGLIGTRATIGSSAYKNIFLKRHASLLVPLVEEGYVRGYEISVFIKKYLKDFKGRVDTLILGCTHYPIIKRSIKHYLGKDIFLVDPAVEIAKEVKQYLQNNNLLKSKNDSKCIYYLTDINDRFLKTASVFLNEDISESTKMAALGDTI